jgi:hypothetical protein
MKWTNVAIVIALFSLFAIAGGWRHLATASSPAGGAGGAPRKARLRGRLARVDATARTKTSQ